MSITSTHKKWEHKQIVIKFNKKQWHDMNAVIHFKEELNSLCANMRHREDRVEISL